MCVFRLKIEGQIGAEITTIPLLHLAIDLLIGDPVVDAAGSDGDAH